jgi:CRP-like cAMP-binding protein
MIRIPQDNMLLEALSQKDRSGFIARCEKVELIFDNILYEPGEPIRYVYFPTDGYISVIRQIDSGASLEIALVGNEGMVGIAPALGISDSMLHILVQGEGTAWRIKTAFFRQELQRKPALQKILDLYIFVRLSQITQAVACTRFHVIESRLARWLLLRQDRAFSSEIPITQLSLAYLLGVRRAGITKAAISLQNRKLIVYKRGILTIINRKGLEAASCECYQADKDKYDHIMG